MKKKSCMLQKNYELIDNWKNCSSLFDKQLILNYKEFYSNYPFHWTHYIELMKKIYFPGIKVLDVGCGCGFFYMLNKKHFSELNYTGIDYSPAAINLATSHWEVNNFFCKNVFELEQNYTAPFDVIFSSALTVVTPYGDDIIRKILTLNSKFIILLKLKCTNKEESYFETESPYGLTTSYVFYHNYKNLKTMFNDNNYSFLRTENISDYYSFLLTKNI